MFNVFTHLEKKAALEKYTDSLNKIIHNHLEQNPNTSPTDILLHHARNCELVNCGEDEPVTKRKRMSDGAATKQTTKRQKTTPLLERNQNLGNAEVSAGTEPEKGGKSSGRVIHQSYAANADINGR